MIKSNLFTKNNIQQKYLDKNSIKKLSNNFKKIIAQIIDDTKDSKKTLNVLSSNFQFNFKIKDLKKFKKFNSIAIVGMGGSILGAEAINNFLEKKIKKKIYFFDNLNLKKLSRFKNKNLNKILFLIISKSGNTIETISNFLTLNIIKKNSKNIILLTEKKK